MVRTIFKSEEFYWKRMEKLKMLTDDDMQALGTGKVAVDQVVSYKGFVLAQFLQLAITNYSSGLEVSKMKPAFQCALSLFAESWQDIGDVERPDYLQDDYSQMLWMLTFGIFLQCSDEEFATIVAVLDKSTRKDWLLEYLIAYRIPGRPYVDTLIFPKPYATLKTAVEETHPQKRSNILRHYLEKEWYPGHKGVYWYDNHKSKHDIFFGYWSFEAAAIVKIAGIDDSSFRDNQYYPKDMLG
jgi:hypothetical protein